MTGADTSIVWMLYRSSWIVFYVWIMLPSKIKLFSLHHHRLRISSSQLQLSLSYDDYSPPLRETYPSSYASTRTLSSSTTKYPYINPIYEPLSHDIHRKGVIGSPEAKQLVVLHGKQLLPLLDPHGHKIR